MSQNSEFERLEQFVAQLLGQYKQLLDKNSQLQSLVHKKEKDIRELQSRISSADSERGDISNRIKGLIDQIEEWQANLPEIDEEAQQNEEDGGGAAAPTEESISESIRNEERDPNHQQRSLFHAERRPDVDFTG